MTSSLESTNYEPALKICMLKIDTFEFECSIDRNNCDVTFSGRLFLSFSYGSIISNFQYNATLMKCIATFLKKSS